ncbi:putative RING finger protein [Frankliniella fusca]|uniref:RING finger protein n=1 Tax=Frankliniella fusca TaxID=407009 RepID=A0AAE1LMC4_9NEOP|nr:putative RING finger protein [Frankliniella fusca]
MRMTQARAGCAFVVTMPSERRLLPSFAELRVHNLYHVAFNLCFWLLGFEGDLPIPLSGYLRACFPGTMQCAVCYESYDICERRPKITPCGHTFCLQCLLLFESNECPTCRAAFNCEPAGLTDNFLALEETADMKFVQRTLWCETCCDAPRLECVEGHDVCSARAALSRCEGEYLGVLRAEQALLGREREARARMRLAQEASADALEERAAAGVGVIADHLRDAGQVWRAAGGGAGSSSGVKAVRAAIRASESRAAAMRDALAVLDATEARIIVKCNGEWRSFSMDLGADAPAPAPAPAPADEASVDRSKLILFTAYALSRSLPPHVQQRTTFALTAAVSSTRAGALPDVTIEFDELPARDALAEQWAKGWRRYSICRRCLESRHSQTFTPQPPDAEGAAIERGAVCVGRSTGKYYFILCDDMRDKFLFPLAVSFKVLGRVVANLGSLETAVRLAQSSDVISVLPKTG